MLRFCEDQATAVFDASSLISILAMPVAGRILCAVSNPSIVSQVRAELKKWPKDGSTIEEQEWQSNPLNLLKIQHLDSAQSDFFTRLIIENKLGSGEAASIAFIKARTGSFLICDDKKASREGRRVHADIQIVSTVSLLRQVHDMGSISKYEVAESLRESLRFARLSIPEEEHTWASSFLSFSEPANSQNARGEITTLAPSLSPETLR